MELGKSLRRAQPWLLWAIILAVAVFILKTKILAPPKVEVVKVTARDVIAQVYGNGTIEAKVMAKSTTAGLSRKNGHK